ncbi:MAG: M20/M25/M40 family metallo-hydrolase [Cyanobacteria bacterium]|nr:M20/M25/M40 family metallo-hydrolase [Cyanobacteriota bacterium]
MNLLQLHSAKPSPIDTPTSLPKRNQMGKRPLLPLTNPQDSFHITHKTPLFQADNIPSNMPPAITPPAPQAALDADVQKMNEWGRQFPVVQTMYDLIDIPSATPQSNPRHATVIEENMTKVRTLIKNYLTNIGITNIVQSADGSLIVRVPGTPGLENRKPLMLTAHMDIVPGDAEDPTRPIKRKLITDNGIEYLSTDGTTTLGADNKGGLALILDNMARLKGKHRDQKTPLPHVPLEILFSPDEESSCDSMKTLDFTQFKSKHVLVVDNFYLNVIVTGLASSVKIDVDLDVPGGGGHSGVDIGLPNRVNANMVLAEIAQAIGTGVIKVDPTRPFVPVLSKNLAFLRGGSAPNAIPEKASLELCLRSNDKNAQEQEILRLTNILKAFEQQYQQIQPGFKLKLNVDEQYPIWEPDTSSQLPGLASAALAEIGGPPTMTGAFHASAQSNLLAPKVNSDGVKFDPILIGPNIRDAHSVREKIDLQSLVVANQWLGKIIQNYSNQSI